MLDLDCLLRLSRPHLVAGIAEDEEGSEYKRCEKYGHDRQPLLRRKVITRLLDFGGESPFRTVPHLII